MRKIDSIIIHCSASRPTTDIGVKEIDQMHRGFGWSRCGYHYVIRRSGAIEAGRPESHIGAHTRGHNANSLGICLVGGINDGGKSDDNFTPAQYLSLSFVILALAAKHNVPLTRVVGHRDLSPDLDGDGVIEKHEFVKECPSFSVRTWLEDAGLLT